MEYLFLDESGKLADSDFVCLAGYISDDDGWSQFSEKWGKLLLQYKIPYVHMKEMVHIKGPYKDLGWTPERRDEILNKFIDVIRAHIQAGFCVAVDAKYLRGMNADARKNIGDPAYFCFHRILGLVIRKLKSVGYQPGVSVTFDDCEEFSVKCYQIWSKLRKKVPDVHHYLPSITFADDQSFWPLQAADILAWTTHKSLRQAAGNYPPPPTIKRMVSAPEEGYGLEYESENWKPKDLDWLYDQITAGKVAPL
jgi:hypothetical protein